MPWTKEQYHKYYEQNKERLKTQAREYHLLHKDDPHVKELRRESIRRYRQRHPDRIKETQRKYYHTEKGKATIKKYRESEKYKQWLTQNLEKNREKHVKATREWRYRNRERVRGDNRERRERRIVEAINLLGGKCQLCGKTENLEFCHISYTQKNQVSDLAWAVLREPDTFLLLCQECHLHPEKWLKELIDIKAKLR